MFLQQISKGRNVSQFFPNVVKLVAVSFRIYINVTIDSVKLMLVTKSSSFACINHHLLVDWTSDLFNLLSSNESLPSFSHILYSLKDLN
jgi:hypothetical protein